MEPVLEVNNLDQSLTYYTEVLGFQIDWTWPDEGKADHASVSLGQGHEEGSHDEHHIHIQLSQSDKQPVRNSGWLYLRLDDEIDQLYKELKGRGARIRQELGNRPWGMREFDVEDINGHLFRFAKPIDHE